MKRVILLCLTALVFSSSVTLAEKGGVAPCLATCFFGDTRIGLYMNEGKPIETDDWITLIGNVASRYAVGSLYSGYKAYEASNSGKGFCVGFLWGRRAGSEINTTKLRSKEILLCIPVIQLYPCVVIPLEAFDGKTMSEVIQEEGLKR